MNYVEFQWGLVRKRLKGTQLSTKNCFWQWNYAHATSLSYVVTSETVFSPKNKLRHACDQTVQAILQKF